MNAWPATYVCMHGELGTVHPGPVPSGKREWARQYLCRAHSEPGNPAAEQGGPGSRTPPAVPCLRSKGGPGAALRADPPRLGGVGTFYARRA